ncbi:MAG: hypothetical protein WCC45_09355 [Paeniglutamicibacter sp.]
MNDFRGVSHQTLSNYLNQHLLGSEGGVNAFRAAADTWKGTAQEPMLLSLARQVMADQEDLQNMVHRLGYGGHPLKLTLSHAVRAVGRVNPVNLLRKRKAGLAQVELDVLIGMLNAKLAMWDTLQLVAGKDHRFDTALLDDLKVRANDQITQVKEIIEATWEERFFAG